MLVLASSPFHFKARDKRFTDLYEGWGKTETCFFIATLAFEMYLRLQLMNSIVPPRPTFTPG